MGFALAAPAKQPTGRQGSDYKAISHLGSQLGKDNRHGLFLGPTFSLQAIPDGFDCSKPRLDAHKCGIVVS